MYQKIEAMIIFHLDFLGDFSNISKNILNAVRRAEIKNLNLLLENRERILSIISTLQSKIETDLSTEKISNDELEIIKAWKVDSEYYINQVKGFDKELLDLLSDQKNNITQEISSLFTSKSKFKGYNLNNVR